MAQWGEEAKLKKNPPENPNKQKKQTRKKTKHSGKQVTCY